MRRTTFAQRKKHKAPSRPQLACIQLEDRLNPGAGTFNGGVFDFAVSIRFDASTSQISKIQDTFTHASQILADATDGQHRFGTIHIFNNSKGGEAAEFWIHSGTGQPTAPRDKYHIRGYHANLFFGSHFKAQQGVDGDAYTIAQQFAHLAYGLEASYAGPNGKAENASLEAESPTLQYSLMDNFFTRGGRTEPNGSYTLNEFSIATNHDPDGDTWQSWINGQSEWQTIAQSRFPAKIPSSLTSAPPPPHLVNFTQASGELTSIITIDNSASMYKQDGVNTRFFYAQKGANAYVDYSRVGNNIGVVTFADKARLPVPQVTIDGDATRQAIKDAINNIQQPPQLGTEMKAGVLRALGQITTNERTRNEVIVLLTDGESFPITDPSLYIPDLLAEGVTVYTIATGGSISQRGQSDLAQIANETGGRYFRVLNPLGTQNILLRLSQEIQGNGMAAITEPSPITAALGRTTEVLVEQGASGVLFASTQENKLDGVLLSVTSPSGKVYFSVDEGEGIETVAFKSHQSIRLSGPAMEPGIWKMTVQSVDDTLGVVQEYAFVDSPGTGVQVGFTQDQASFPDPMTIRATPTYLGLPITGANVQATITAPNGDTVTIPMFDDGSAANGDVIPGDGIYAARYNGYQLNGSYTVTVSVEGENAIFANPDPSMYTGDYSDYTIVPFNRFATASILLTGVPNTTSNTDLSIAISGPMDRLQAGDTGLYTVQIRNEGLVPSGTLLSNLFLPSGLVIGSVVPTAGNVSKSGNRVGFTMPNLAPGQVVEYKVTATATTTGAFLAWGDVRMTSVFDFNLENNRADLLLPSQTSPGLSPIPEAFGFMGETIGPILFLVSDAESPTSSLQVTATSTNTTLFPAGSLTLAGTGAERSISITPAANETGSGAITVTVTDPDGLSYSRTFVVTVTMPPPPPPPPNTPPTISAVTDIQLAPGVTSSPIALLVGDLETPAGALIMSATSSNPNLIPESAIIFGGSGANRTVTVTPALGLTGLATITIAVRDEGSRIATTTFSVTVSVPPNTAPTITSLGNRSIVAGTSTGPISFTIGDLETPIANLVIVATSSDTQLLPDSKLVISGEGAERTLTINSTPGRYGSAVITIAVTDGDGLTTNETFTLTLTEPTDGGGGGGGGGGNTDPDTLLLGWPPFAVGADAGALPQVNYYEPNGSLRYSVVPFGETFTGGVRTAVADFNGDGVADLVVATGPGGPSLVRILDGVTQNEIFSIAPFESRFTGGVFVSVGDLNGDGRPDLVITPDEGGGPRVRVIDGKSFATIADFFGIDDPNFRGGARSAIGDVNGDGIADLIVAAGFQGGPRVAGFLGGTIGPGLTPQRVFADFFAFEDTLRNGVYLAVGDIDGDGYADVVAGAGPGGGPRILAFSGKALTGNQYVPLANFFGGDPENRAGIRIAVKNLDDDSRADLVVGPGQGSGNRVTAYLGRDTGPDGSPPAWLDFNAFADFGGGIYVG